MTPERWLAAFVLVNVLDAALTLYAIKLGGSEGNPLMRLAMRRVHPALVLLVVKSAYLIAAGAFLDDIAPWLPLLTAVFAGVCAWNVLQIMKLRH